MTERRVITFPEARKIALAALYRAENIRAAAIVDEARRQAALDNETLDDIAERKTEGRRDG